MGGRRIGRENKRETRREYHISREREEKMSVDCQQSKTRIQNVLQNIFRCGNYFRNVVPCRRDGGTSVLFLGVLLVGGLKPIWWKRCVR